VARLATARGTVTPFPVLDSLSNGPLLRDWKWSD